MSDISQVRDLLSLDPDTYMELFEVYIDASVGFLRLHAGKNFNANLIYEGNEYLACFIQFAGAETNSSGALPRPTIVIANINGLVSDYIKNKNDLNNCYIRRTKILARNLDDVNFPDNLNPFYGFKSKWSYPDYGPSFFTDTYIINNKKSETKYSVEFELSSPLDMENVFLPARKINDNLCSFVYRGAGCCYGKRNNFVQKVGNNTIRNVGAPVADVYNRKFLNNKQYNIEGISNKGIWQTGKIYSAGDFVLVQNIFSYDFSKESVQPSSDDLVGDYYVCINTGTISGQATNPKFDRANWVKDECSKTLEGCKIRWHEYVEQQSDEIGGESAPLPYGGFPGTRPYDYRT